MDQKQAMKLMATYSSRIAKFIKSNDEPFLVCDYDSSVENPVGCVNSLSEFLEVEPKKSASQFIRSQEQLRAHQKKKG